MRQDRFLEFERWWNGYYRLSGEEIVAIIEDLFVGNKLEQGEVRIDDHCAVDLKRLRSPLVIFASYGDNITPPHQALRWIPAVYASTDDLKRAGQRIVYLTNPHVGHLGIFVSASVARFEHRAILEHLGAIEGLEPGLYEMRIDNPTGDPDCARDQYVVRFEPRKVEDLRFDYPRAAFERVRALSEFNEILYRTFMSPWVRAVANPWLSLALEWLHPMRASRYIFSERVNPCMGPFAVLAEVVARDRHPLGNDHPLMLWERKFIAETLKLWEDARKMRDDARRPFLPRSTAIEWVRAEAIVLYRAGGAGRRHRQRSMLMPAPWPISSAVAQGDAALLIFLVVSASFLTGRGP